MPERRNSESVPGITIVNPGWITSLLFALLFVAAPFGSILRIMQQLPKPLALSHRKWPMALNVGLIGIITGGVAVFIYAAYYRGEFDEMAAVMQFVIAGIGYIFGLVLLLRQFAGVYPDYIIVTGGFGLMIRKIAYRKISNVEEISERHGEATLRVRTGDGASAIFALPARYVSLFHNQVRSRINLEDFGPHH